MGYDRERQLLLLPTEVPRVLKCTEDNQGSPTTKRPKDCPLMVIRAEKDNQTTGY